MVGGVTDDHQVTAATSLELRDQRFTWGIRSQVGAPGESAKRRRRTSRSAESDHDEANDRNSPRKSQAHRSAPVPPAAHVPQTLQQNRIDQGRVWRGVMRMEESAQ